MTSLSQMENADEQSDARRVAVVRVLHFQRHSPQPGDRERSSVEECLTQWKSRFFPKTYGTPWSGFETKSIPGPAGFLQSLAVVASGTT
ncbi:MAG: hypothetical protein FJ267_07980 [Planctomycetes bacterium]|nr:hypothetical protein [Planctomycetota bacterium]